MSEHVWDKYLSEKDRTILEKTGIAQRAGFGDRPAVLVIDTTWAFTGDKNEPLLDSMNKFTLSCGDYAWNALPAIKRLIQAGRTKGLPIIYTTTLGFRKDFFDAGSWAWKMTKAVDDASIPKPGVNIDGNAVHEDIAPEPQDFVINKHKPSAFHGTPLNSFLNLFGADSLLVAGGVTSGCLRATVCDAFNENYRVAVVEEGCFDRFESSHALSLFDMDSKYADVLGIDIVEKFIECLPNNLFKLPRASCAQSVTVI